MTLVLSAFLVSLLAGTIGRCKDKDKDKDGKQDTDKAMKEC